MGMKMANTQDKPFIHLTVSDPMMHATWEDGQYTSYAVNIETNSYSFSVSKSMVRRRYSEFVHLRKLLKSQHPNIRTPTLPPKALFADKFNETFIEKRRIGLEKFLLKVLDVVLYLSNKSVHMFLQSNSATQEIENVVGGNYQEPSRGNSHLLLHRFLSEEYMGSDRSSDCTDVDFHDYDLPDSSQNFDSSSIRSLTDSHSHVTLGSRITICTPTLHVPTNTESPRPFSPASFASNEEYVISRHSNTPPLLHDHLHLSSANSSSSLGSEPQVRKKKVSFSSEITVAHVFSNHVNL